MNNEADTLYRQAQSRGVEILTRTPPPDFPAEWYDVNSREHFWFRWRLQALLQQLESLGLDRREPLRVLDIGCGTGIVGQDIEARTDWVVDGVDLHLAGLVQAEPGRGRLYCYDVLESRPEFREAYDLVLLLDVIEHFEAPAEFLSASAACLRPGGILAVNVPAHQWLYSVYDRVQGHACRYTRDALAAVICEISRLTVRDIRYWGLLLIPVLGLRKLLLSGRRSSSEIIRRGFVPPSPFINRCFLMMMAMETRLWKRPWFGISLLLAAAKDEAS